MVGAVDASPKAPTPGSESGTNPAKRRKVEGQEENKGDFDALYEEARLKAAEETLKGVKALQEIGILKSWTKKVGIYVLFIAVEFLPEMSDFHGVIFLFRINYSSHFFIVDYNYPPRNTR